ncbi:MAG: hypothetical protein ACP5VS_09720, partial [Desulfomonilaceae bacterium]
MFVYFALILVVLFSGMGLLKLSRVKLDATSSIYLAPILTLSMWSLLIGYGVLWGYTVAELWRWGYLVTLMLAVYGLFSQFGCFKKLDISAIFLLALLPVILMFPYFLYGVFTYMGSPSWDGWHHVAQGQSLWTYPREAEGGLAPLYQYAAHVSHNRFVAQSLLGFLSPLTGQPGDTKSASGLFLALCFFVFASSILFFASSRRLGRPLSLVYASATVLSAWMLNLLKANNYDNVMAISCLPAIAGIQAYLSHDDFGQPVLLALLAAAQLYIYPEMTPLVLGFTVVFVFQKIYADKLGLKKWGLFLCAATIMFLVFSLPTLTFSFKFFIQQFRTASVTLESSRPGQNMFSYLLAYQNWIANMWGLFVPLDFGFGIESITLNMVGLLFSALAVIGMFNRVRQGDWTITFFVLTIWFGALFMILKENYDYGAYKILNMGWWASSFTVFAGVSILKSRWRSAILQGAAAILLVFFLTNTGLLISRFNNIISPKSVVYYEQVHDIKKIVMDKPVLVYIDDVYTNQWSVYFLRDLNILVNPYRGYMAQKHVIPFMDRAHKPPVEQIAYVLTDSRVVAQISPKEPVWRAGKLILLDVAPFRNDYAVYSVSDPEGMGAKVGEGHPVWIGGQETCIDVWAGKNGQVELVATLEPGPGTDENQARRVLFSTDNGFQKKVEFSGVCNAKLVIPVRCGSNQILIKTLG